MKLRAADPQRVLTELGKLAFVEVQAGPQSLLRTMKFRHGELLAYDTAHLLAITYRTGDRAPIITDAKARAAAEQEIDEARRRYRWSHFGARGTARLHEVDCADPRARWTAIGEITRVGYRTTKAGDPPNTIYEHAFAQQLPLLAQDAKRRLLILGGSYRITWRGIVG